MKHKSTKIKVLLTKKATSGAEIICWKNHIIVSAYNINFSKLSYHTKTYHKSQNLKFCTELSLTFIKKKKRPLQNSNKKNLYYFANFDYVSIGFPRKLIQNSSKESSRRLLV